MLNFKKTKTILISRLLVLPGVLIFTFLFSFSCKKDEVEPGTGDDDRSPMVIVPDVDGVDYEGDAPFYSKVNVFNRDILLPGFNNFRIPALVTTTQGTLLAFSEMRTGGDLDPKTLVYRRSEDNGETWGEVTLVEEYTTTKVYGNENVVVDENTGAIHLLYLQVFPTTGGNSCTMYHKVSIDDGVSWSERKTVANVINAKWRPLGPAAGIQLQRGKNAGRLLFPGRYSDNQSGNYAIYSDDGGESWNLGYKSVQISSIGVENETTCIELSYTNGDESVIYVNSRDQKTSPDTRRRMEVYSYDSGESLTGSFKINDYIKTVKIQGALFRATAIDQGDNRNHICFSAPSYAKENLGGAAINNRRHLGIWSTFDETETWTPVAKRINDVGGSYSSMARTADGFIGILFEEGESVSWDETAFVKINDAFLDVPLIGAKWDFEELTTGSAVDEKTKLTDSFKNGTERDIEVYGSLPTVKGSETFQQNVALKFDGNGFLKLEDIDTWTQFDFSEYNSFSVEMVLKADKPGNTSFLMGKPHRSNWPQWVLHLETDGTVSFRIDDDEGFAFVKSKIEITDGKWHHVAAVRDRNTRKLKIYIDGELSNEIADELKGSVANRRPLYIGGTESGKDHFKGEIDFVRITPEALNKFLD